ncbi:MAG: acetyl-CoA carboxylase biotin carboxyl carrier protein [Pirellulales bacterium]|nr:acetyl-CoA carboxylase biotin carboxyl carrier protein [Pirellulales bacterium]
MTNSGAGQGDIFDVKKVRRLVELMKEHDLSEIDLKQGEQRVRLRRGYEPQVSGTVAPPLAMSSVPAPAPAAASKPAASSAPPDDANQIVIKSPMVGTYYSRPNPESPNYVKIGDHIGAETVVCIIEAMKVFNQIPAEVTGQVTAILVENGQPVEFGQPLFKLSPG